MKIYLSITPANCFRSPAVLERIREGLRGGGKVAISTRDHPETLPNGVVHAGDNWMAVVAACPDLAVFDNLLFEELRGREFRRWDGDVGRYVSLSVGVLKSVFNDLDGAGTKEVLLVAEGKVVSLGWREWLSRRPGFQLLRYPEAEGGPVARRQWRLSDPESRPPSTCLYSEGRLLKPSSPESPRQFEARVFTPAAEALLALTAEYAAVRFDSWDPEDPRGLNQRYDMCHEILEAFGGTGDPRELLTAMEDLYDLVSEHVDFSRWKPSWERAVNTDSSDKEGTANG